MRYVARSNAAVLCEWADALQELRGSSNLEAFCPQNALSSFALFTIEI